MAKRISEKKMQESREKRGKGGQPPKKIDEKKLYLLAQTLLPIETIATILECHKDTLYDRYSDILQTARENRKASLSQVMWHQALVEKSEKMMIWLSKQHLGYRDVQPDEVPVTNFSIQLSEVPRPESKPIEINELPAKKLELLG